MDAGALDDLDLDDMFADDGDMLFDGLDIQLDGMGDLIPASSSSTTKKDTRRAGPRTHRPPLTDDDGIDDDDAEEATLRRRQTKRKTKTPVAFGDEDDDYLDDTQPKKKVRKMKGAPTPAPVTTKKNNKATGNTKKSLIPPPTELRATSSVAAAGRFGKRGTGSTTKITKRKALATDETPQAPALPAFTPKQESTYGGLAPSKTQFYPFIESVPPEPNLKSRKQYPQIDKFFAAFTGYMSLGGTGNEGGPPNMSSATSADLSMESPIMQLLIESFEGVSDRDKAAFGDLKKQAMLACLPQVRHVIQSTDPIKLLPDLYSMCGLLTRQYNFIDTCLTNMEMWCKEEFSDSDFCQAFSLPEPFQPEKVGTIIASSNRKWKKQIINVKIAFVGNKDIKGGVVLQARMPQALVTAGEKKKSDGTSIKKTKAKEKIATSVKKSLSSVSYKAVTPRTYPDLAPAERRQRILERVAQLALRLETQLNYRRAKSSSSPALGSTDNKKASTLAASNIPLEDPPLHTARMWEWLEAAGFFQASLVSDTQSLKEARLGLQSPEQNPRGMLFPKPVRILGRIEKDNDQNQNMHISSHGLFDRLQSLLVVEGDLENIGNLDHRTRVDESDDDSETEDEESLGFLDQSDEDDEDVTQNQPRVDLSDLSLEERTFLHLCSIGLIKKPLFPMVELILDDKDDEIEDDLVNVVGEMSAELNTLTTRNNARIRHLETVMDPINLAYRKQADEEQASLISRCQSLLKRGKEKTKKSNKQKSAVAGSKDDLDLPW
jgi:hypothetical protein